MHSSGAFPLYLGFLLSGSGLRSNTVIQRSSEEAQECTIPDEPAVVVIKGLTPESGSSLAFSEKSLVALQFLLDELIKASNCICIDTDIHSKLPDGSVAYGILAEL